MMPAPAISHITANPIVRYWNSWIQPRSQDRDIAFRENTIRVTSGALVIVLAVALVLQLAVFGLVPQSLPFMALIAVTLLMSSASAIEVNSGRIARAGYILTGTFVMISMGLILLVGINSPTVLPTLILTLIMATLLLPRSQLVYVAILCLVSAAIISSLQGTVLPAAPTPDQPQSLTLLSGAFIIALAYTYLRQIRVEFDNRMTAILGSLTETERAKEEADKARQRAEAADKAKTQFLANMSHELRTPLNAIIGYTEIMIGGMAGTFTDKQLQLLGHVHHNAKRLLELINNVLNLARIESGRLDIRNSPANPVTIVAELVGSMKSLADKRNISLTASFADSAPEAVICDVSKVQQILTNLIGNAIKFTNKGGVTVTVSAPDSQHWQFSVSDTGNGMPAEAPNYIFDMFRQVDGADTREHQGTGLGLAITKRLTEGMGGTIAVQTELGKGSTFTVTLPRPLSDARPSGEIPRPVAVQAQA